MEIPELKSLNRNTIREKYISIHYPEFYNYVTEHYPTDLSWTEKLYWYYNDLIKYPTCPMCGTRVKFEDFGKGYRNYCSYKCLRNSPIVKEKTKQTWLNKYGVENPFSSVEIKEKIKQSFLDKYGVEHPSQSKSIKEKKKQTTMRHYSVENPFSSAEIKEKIKQTCLNKYGADNPSKSQQIINVIISKAKEIQEKSYITKKQNNSFHSSKIEQQFKQWLDDNDIKYEKEYRSDKYPFKCDFYFPDKDLYLEIQGTWTHGDHPYNPDDENDRMIAEEWKNKHTDYYDIAHRVWTIDDPLKRETAKKNNLNWIEVFSCKLDDVVDYYLSN